MPYGRARVQARAEGGEVVTTRVCELEECNAVFPMTRPNRRFCSEHHRKVAEDRRRYEHQRDTMSWIDLEKRQLRKSALRRKRRVEQLRRA
jgi:hypothetical protein